MMKQRSIFRQFIAAFVILFLVFSVVASLFMFRTLRTFFTEETYQSIISAQRFIANRFNTAARLEEDNWASLLDDINVPADIRSVYHIAFLETSRGIVTTALTNQRILSAQAMENIKRNILQQTAVTERYELVDNDQKYMYIISRRQRAIGEKIVKFYLVSYMPDYYKNELTRQLFLRMALLINIAVLAVLIIALTFMNKVSGHFKILREKVNHIAHRQWQEEIVIEGNDEIAILAQDIEAMRQQLVKFNENQQFQFQALSHELKTPIMVVQGYIEAYKEGVFPKGTPAATIAVIETEMNRLNNLVRNILYLNKLEYLQQQQSTAEQVQVDLLLFDLIERFKYQRSELEWIVDIEPLVITGNTEQLTVAFDNIFENQLRYARTLISVSCKASDNNGQITICNDGPQIPASQLESIFNLFEKGIEGKSGLGLAISKRIINNCKGEIYVINSNRDVCFIITFK